MKQYESNDFLIKAPNSLKFITDNMISIINESINFYKEIFDVSEFRKIQINYFDDLEEFRNYIYKLRGESKSLPEYAIGTFDNGMINSYINPNIEINSNLYYKRLYMASHELFHIMYRELIWENNYERITWFDEGMAQLFSGEKKYILEETRFKKWVLNVKNSTKIIPDLNLIDHGNSFANNNYNGYDLGLLVVKYIYDNLGLIKFKEILYKPLEIKKYGIMVNKIFDFYCK